MWFIGDTSSVASALTSREVLAGDVGWIKGYVLPNEWNACSNGCQDVTMKDVGVSVYLS